MQNINTEVSLYSLVVNNYMSFVNDFTEKRGYGEDLVADFEEQSREFLKNKVIELGQKYSINSEYVEIGKCIRGVIYETLVTFMFPSYIFDKTGMADRITHGVMKECFNDYQQEAWIQCLRKALEVKLNSMIGYETLREEGKKILKETFSVLRSSHSKFFNFKKEEDFKSQLRLELKSVLIEYCVSKNQIMDTTNLSNQFMTSMFGGSGDKLEEEHVSGSSSKEIVQEVVDKVGMERDWRSRSQSSSSEQRIQIIQKRIMYLDAQIFFGELETKYQKNYSTEEFNISCFLDECREFLAGLITNLQLLDEDQRNEFKNRVSQSMIGILRRQGIDQENLNMEVDTFWDQFFAMFDRQSVMVDSDVYVPDIYYPLTFGLLNQQGMKGNYDSGYVSPSEEIHEQQSVTFPLQTCVLQEVPGASPDLALEGMVPQQSSNSLFTGKEIDNKQKRVVTKDQKKNLSNNLFQGNDDAQMWQRICLLNQHRNKWYRSNSWLRWTSFVWCPFTDSIKDLARKESLTPAQLILIAFLTKYCSFDKGHAKNFLNLSSNKKEIESEVNVFFKQHSMVEDSSQLYENLKNHLEVNQSFSELIEQQDQSINKSPIYV